MRVSVCLRAIVILEYPDFHSGSQEQNSQNIFRNIFLFRNIPNERALRFIRQSEKQSNKEAKECTKNVGRTCCQLQSTNYITASDPRWFMMVYNEKCLTKPSEVFSPYKRI